jgi:hypothetical protein
MAAYSRGILTMAFGSAEYLEMAKSLARSLMIHSPQIPRAIITDAAADADMTRLFDVRVPVNADFGSALVQKLFLDRYTPFHSTLFIDSDCLVVTDLDRIWRYFDGLPFGIPGVVRLKRGDEDPLFDVDFILDYFDLQEVSKFNSGMIYFDSSDVSKSIFRTARELQSRHLELRFLEGDHDEALFEVAMAINGIQAFIDDGETMLTPAGIHGHIALDVVRGVAVFSKYGVVRRPAVVHFAGPFSKTFEYRRECYKLRSNYDGSLGQRVAIAGLWFRSRRVYTLTRLSAARARVSLLKHQLTDMFRAVLRSTPTAGVR